MNTDTYNIDDLYRNLEAAETQRQQQQSGNADYLKPKPGFTYVVKILPFVKDPATKTFVPYKHHGWNSVVDGKFVSTGACPRTFGGKCAVCDAGYSSYTKQEQYNGTLKSKLLLGKATNLVNVLIIEDEEHPDNNGKVKVLRYSSVLNELIRGALYGDDKEKFGKKIFDFTKAGYALEIVVKKGANKQPPSYAKSRFIPNPQEIKGAELKEILAATKDLTTLIPQTKEEGEITKILAAHFFGDMAPTRTSTRGARPPADDDDTEAQPPEDEDVDAQIGKLISGLED